MKYSATLGLMALAGAAVAYGWTQARVVRPLRRLIERTSALEHGDLDALQTPCGGTSEIDALRRSMASMAEHVHRAQVQTRTYTDALTAGQEAERARLARELHDETIQALVGVAHSIDLAAQMLDINGDKARQTLQDAREQAVAGVETLRRLIADLRPPALDELGLVAALKMLVAEPSPMQTFFQVEGKERRLNPGIELMLFRVAQEGLRNAARHSGATHARVRLVCSADRVRLTLCDNGVGFDSPPDMEGLASQGHYGLVGLSERVNSVGGTFQLTSAHNEGVVIEVDMPLGDPDQPENTVRDPVCSAIIQPERAYGSAEYKGQIYYFCCPVCLGAFQKDPEAYLVGA